MTIYFDHTFSRHNENANGEYDEISYTISISCFATGHCNQDAGAGDARELDDWSIEDWYGLPEFKLNESEIEEIEAAAQAHLNEE